MIGMSCPWCDETADIGPGSLTADAFECQECHTRVDLAPAPQGARVASLPAAQERELRPAA